MSQYIADMTTQDAFDEGTIVVTPSGIGKVFKTEGQFHLYVAYPDGSSWGYNVEECAIGGRMAVETYNRAVQVEWVRCVRALADDIEAGTKVVTGLDFECDENGSIAALKYATPSRANEPQLGSTFPA